MQCIRAASKCRWRDVETLSLPLGKVLSAICRSPHGIGVAYGLIAMNPVGLRHEIWAALETQTQRRVTQNSPRLPAELTQPFPPHKILQRIPPPPPSLTSFLSCSVAGPAAEAARASVHNSEDLEIATDFSDMQQDGIQLPVIIT